MRKIWTKYFLLLLAGLILTCTGIPAAAETPVAAPLTGIGPEISILRGELTKVQGTVIYVKGATYQTNQETVVLSPAGARTILPAGDLPRQVVMKYYLPESMDEAVKPVAVEIQLLPVQAQ